MCSHLLANQCSLGLFVCAQRLELALEFSSSVFVMLQCHRRQIFVVLLRNIANDRHDWHYDIAFWLALNNYTLLHIILRRLSSFILGLLFYFVGFLDLLSLLFSFLLFTNVKVCVTWILSLNGLHVQVWDFQIWNDVFLMFLTQRVFYLLGCKVQLVDYLVE